MSPDIEALLRELNECRRVCQNEIDHHLVTQSRLDLLRKVMERSRQAVVITDANNVIQDVNAAYVTMSGFSRAAAIGQTPSIGKSGRHDKAFYERMWSALATDNYWEGEIWDRRENGEAYPKYLNISRILDAAGEVTNYLAMFEDLSEQKALESELERRTHYDPLTGLANKVLFRNRLEHEFHVAERHKRNVGLLLLKLDRFRQVNESLGYLAGDRLIQEVSVRLSDSIRKTDLIARENDSEERSADTISRVGGNEFTFILADLAVPENAAIAARRMLECFTLPYLIDGQEIYLSASIGISIWPQNAATLEGMLSCVEKALDDALEAGGNTYRFFSDEMNRASSNRFLLECEMRKAITTEGFVLAYQPKLDLATGDISGVEALVRWRRDDGSMVSPADFIPLAEETGLILPLGEWILETACRDIQAINQRLGRRLSVAVNLSARQFQYGKVPQLVDRVLATTGLPAELLELEITESVVMRDVHTVIATMQAIRARGVALALDDFGTGYSSLAYLKSFPITALKIDRSFVMDIESNQDAVSICDITVLLAHKLGLAVVAEGVETAGQLKFLLSVGCEMVQGYLFSKPLFCAELAQFVENHRPMAGQGTSELWSGTL
ncbi:MAG: EAL domain-containing protein [Rhodocyclaceae bacterium]|nr:EAL domain-containing protein [Rhodocyclaceae bacterium]MDZ4214911.1 EAL domain-containing protein [Rhodocyclaceae bacterium]